jgi:hypothetical protein
MSGRAAEEAIGGMKMYRYPNLSKGRMDSEEWLGLWMRGKYVLLGWESVKRGVIKSFQEGRVRHMIDSAHGLKGEQDRPLAGVLCRTAMYPVWNWQAGSGVKRTPLVLLNSEQAPYFALCKRCEAAMKDMVGDE